MPICHLLSLAKSFTAKFFSGVIIYPFNIITRQNFILSTLVVVSLLVVLSDICVWGNNVQELLHDCSLERQKKKPNYAMVSSR